METLLIVFGAFIAILFLQLIIRGFIEACGGDAGLG